MEILSQKWFQESHFSWYLLQIWNINSLDMWLSNPLLFWIAPGLISCICLWNKKKHSVWFKHFSRHFSVYNFYFLSIINSGWCIVKPRVSSFQRYINCVCSTLLSGLLSGNVTILYLGRSFSAKWGCRLTGKRKKCSKVFLKLLYEEKKTKHSLITFSITYKTNYFNR